MSVTFTDENISGMRKVKAVLVSAADGSASGFTPTTVTGEVMRFVAIPDGGGTQPTNLWDVTLTDDDGYDIITGQGANLSNAAPTTVVDSMGAICNDRVHVTAANMGDTKGATLYLYVR
jgi:hypothetical protein